MCLEGLYFPLGLILLMVSGWDEFVLHAIFLYLFLECLGCLVVEDVPFEAKAGNWYSVHYLLVCPHHYLPCPGFHRLNKDVVHVKVDGNHYVPVVVLGWVRGAACLV